MDAYSTTLALGLAAAFGALGLALLARWQRRGGTARSQRLARWSAAIAALVLTYSGLSHWRFGHGEGSLEAMGVTAFAAAHPAVLVGAACTGVAWVLISSTGD